MKSSRKDEISVFLNSFLLLTILLIPLNNTGQSFGDAKNRYQNVIDDQYNSIPIAFEQNSSPELALTYHNNILGFEIQYPNSLQLKNWDPEDNILSSISLFEHNCSYQCEEISITLFSMQLGLSLKQWVDLHSESNYISSEYNLEPPVFDGKNNEQYILIYDQPAIIFSQELHGLTIGRILIGYPEAVVSFLYTDFGKATFKDLFPGIVSSFRANDNIIDFDKKKGLYETIRQKIKDFIIPNSISGNQIPNIPEDQGYKLPYTAGQTYQVKQGWGGTYSHTGIAYYAYDFGLPVATEVRASKAGAISVAVSSYTACGGPDYANYTNRVVINHSDGTATLYLHLQDVVVSQGSNVNGGDLIGHSGNVGWTNCTYHLHFQRQAQGGWWTQSQPIYFDEYPGQQLYYLNYYTSQNSNNSCPGPSQNSPSNDYVSSSQTITFSWTGPSGCTYQGFTFRVKDTSNMDSGGTTIYDEGQGGTSVTKTFDTQWNNRDLYWGVRTVNPLSPNWSVRHFRIEPTQSCTPNSNQISLYVDTNFSGQCVTKDLGEYSNPSAIGMPNDSISSIRVGSNVQAVLCRDDNFSGTCETFTGDDSNLGDNSIGDNQVSSAKVQTRSTGYPVTLYVDANYSGGWCALTGAGWTNICDGYNDTASSIRLIPGWSARVWVDINRAGASRCITSDISDFSGLQYNENGSGSLNDSISSFMAYQQSSCPSLIPDTPSNFRVSETTYNSITLAWDDVSYEEGYRIYRWGYVDGLWDFYYLSSVGANVTYFTDTSLQCGGADYYYQVSAYNSQGESFRTGWIQGTTAACPIPDTPTNFRVSDTTYNSITLTWDDVSYEEGYKVYKWGYQDGVWDFYYLSSVGVNVTYYTNTSLQCGGEDYYYQVSAYNSLGESSRTGWIQGTTAVCPIPNTPTNFRVSSTTYNSITLAWDDVNNEDGYKVYKWGSENGVWDFYYLTSVGANVTYFTDIPLQCGDVWYLYQVSAFNSLGESSRSGWITGNTAACPLFTLTINKTGTGFGTVTSSPDGINCGDTCTYAFTINTTVTLTATVILPSTFIGWSGAGCSGLGSCVVLMDSVKNVNAIFNYPGGQTLSVSKDGTGSGTITSNPTGIDCGSACSADFIYDTSVTLNATASNGSTFTGWNGSGCTGIGTCTVTMDSAKSVTATFMLNAYNLNVSKNGTGSGTITSNPDGIDCGSTCVANFDYNTSVTLNATASNGSIFTGWSGSGCTGAGTCTVTMDSAKSITATFIINSYSLNISKSGTGTGMITSNPVGIYCGSICSANFNHNTNVTLSAAASNGSSFSGWSGSGCNGTGACTVTMDSAKSVTATFMVNAYTLNVSKNGTGSGTITSNPAGIDCGSTCAANFNYNTSVTLSVSVSNGSSFIGWSGSGCTGTGTCTVTMDSAKSVTATFIVNIYTLNVSKSGTGSGMIISNPAGIDCGSACSYDFTSNTSVTLTAIPIFPSVFGGWNGGGCSGINTCIVLINSDEFVTAYFFLNIYKIYIPYANH